MGCWRGTASWCFFRLSGFVVSRNAALEGVLFLSLDSGLVILGARWNHVLYSIPTSGILRSPIERCSVLFAPLCVEDGELVWVHTPLNPQSQRLQPKPETLTPTALNSKTLNPKPTALKHLKHATPLEDQSPNPQTLKSEARRSGPSPPREGTEPPANEPQGRYKAPRVPRSLEMHKQQAGHLS